MTYAGFKSLLAAGLDVKDPRVQAALEWLRRHWTLDENPGLGDQGYYYYLHVMSRALRAFGQDSITDDSGKVHDWRREMAERLLALQEPDGSWINRKSDRWLEGESCLATAYAVLALEEVMASGVTASPSEMVPELQSSVGSIRLTVGLDSSSRTSGQHRSGRDGDAEGKEDGAIGLVSGRQQNGHGLLAALRRP